MVILTTLTIAFLAYLAISIACYLSGTKVSFLLRIRSRLPAWAGGVKETEGMFTEILKTRDKFNTSTSLGNETIPKVPIPVRLPRHQPKYLDRYHFTQLHTETFDTSCQFRREERSGPQILEASGLSSQNFGGSGGLTLPFLPRETFECVDGAYSRKGTRVPGNAAFASFINNQRHIPNVHENPAFRNMHKDLHSPVSLLLSERRPGKADLPPEFSHAQNGRGIQCSPLTSLSNNPKLGVVQGRKKLRKAFNLSDSLSQPHLDQLSSKLGHPSYQGSAAAAVPSQRSRGSRTSGAGKRKNLGSARVFPKTDLSVIPESREESEDKRSTCITEQCNTLGHLAPLESAYYTC